MAPMRAGEGPNPRGRARPGDDASGRRQRGEACCHHPRFERRPMANGERLDADSNSAAGRGSSIGGGVAGRPGRGAARPDAAPPTAFIAISPAASRARQRAARSRTTACPSTPSGRVQPASVMAVPRMRASRAAVTASGVASRPNSRSIASPARSISASTRASSATMPRISAGGSGSSPARIAISPIAAISACIGPSPPPREAKAPKATARAASPSTSRASPSTAASAGGVSRAPAAALSVAPAGIGGTPPSARARLMVARASMSRCSEMAGMASCSDAFG